MSDCLATVSLKIGEPLRGFHAGDVGEVLDRNRQTGEQAAFAGRLLHQRFGVRAGAVEAKDRQRIGLAVDLGDPVLKRVEQVQAA